MPLELALPRPHQAAIGNTPQQADCASDAAIAVAQFDAADAGRRCNNDRQAGRLPAAATP